MTRTRHALGLLALLVATWAGWHLVQLGWALNTLFAPDGWWPISAAVANLALTLTLYLRRS
jgi:hypothetical protein